jgi:hypothetical protein
MYKNITLTSGDHFTCLLVLNEYFFLDAYVLCEHLLNILCVSLYHINIHTAQWYSTGLRAGWSGVRVPTGDGNLSIHHRVQTGSGAHPASYPMVTGSSFPGGKAAGE